MDNKIDLFRQAEPQDRQTSVMLQAKTLKGVDALIAKASNSIKIGADYDRVELAQQMQVFQENMEYIARDVGIKALPHDWKDYYLPRLWILARKYFSDLTNQEILLAFELLIVGDLDEYFAKDREGNPEKSHYGTFSAEYFSKVLKAYKVRKYSTVNKAYAMLPEASQEWNEQRAIAADNKLKNCIVADYKHYLETGEFPNYICTVATYQLLTDAGHAVKIVEDKNHVARANDILKQEFRPGEGIIAVSIFSEARNDAVRKTFKYMKSQGIKPDEIFTKNKEQ